MDKKTKHPFNDNLCVFQALSSHLQGKQRLEEDISKLFNLFIKKMDGLSADELQRGHMNDIPIVEDLLTLSILLYDIDIVHGNIIGELARRSLQKNDNTVRVLRYNNHICYVNNITVVFHSFRSPNCDSLFNRTFNLERHLTTCSERVKNMFAKNVYQSRATLFDKLDSFGIEYTNEQTFFKNLAKFDSESICVHEESFKDTDKTKWNGKRFPISVSISSNLVKEPFFLCNSDPQQFVTSFIGDLENSALHSKTIMNSLFSDFQTTIKIKLGSILEKVTQPHNPRV